MDIWTKGKRSEVMAKIRGKNTKPELLVRRFLFSKGYRYRIHVKHLPGTPDIVLPKYNVVIFVDGCFWHGHAVDGRLPHSNLEFWASKIKHNKERDFKNTQKLLSMGWKVITIWECQLKPHEKESTLLALDNLLNKLFLDKYRVEPSSNNNP